MPETFHALVLNFHQPAGNLEALLDEAPWEVEQILYAMDRIPRSIWGFEDVARVHVTLSGTLLETLRDPAFQRRVYGWVDCGSLLWYLQNERLFEVLATGYYHPVLPLIPAEDRREQLSRWLGIGRHLLWHEHFAGVWPPELGFSMELVPTLAQLGFRYAIVDSENVVPRTPMRWDELRYRPHLARHEGHEIIVIVRDRDLSNAQESGLEYEWFAREVEARTRYCDFPALVTTCSDGDNGGWFRNTNPSANFWGAFHQPYLNEVRAGRAPVRPMFISEYLDRFGAEGEVMVETAAWNTGDHDGRGFVQWTGSQAQRDALERVAITSNAIHTVLERAAMLPADPRFLATDSPEHLDHELEEALWHCLRAQTSCNFFWGEAWVPRCHRDLDRAWTHLHAARDRLPPGPERGASPPPSRPDV